MSMTPSVGAEIEAQCGRCHDATTHKIVTVEKDRPRRLQCLQCDALHLYRKPTGPEPARGSSTPRPRKNDPAVIFKKALQEASGEPPQKYVLSGSFQVGQRLEHKTFGEGVVTKVIRPHVMEVTFKDATRLLAMSR
ncbi:MAG: hypothetical protein ACE5ID_12380 [Acidobacteriota bacterium]